MRKKGGLVYSTDQGRVCPGCGHPADACACSAAASAGLADGGPVRVSRQTKGRRGKEVTVVTGLPLAPAELADLGRQLRKKCGSGGTAKDGIIVIQGDHCDRVLTELDRLGFAARRSGG